MTKLPVTSAQSSCPNLSSIIDCLQQDLVSPSRVTPINAEKLGRELYFHPDQTQVDYVISSRPGWLRDKDKRVGDKSSIVTVKLKWPMLWRKANARKLSHIVFPRWQSALMF